RAPRRHHRAAQRWAPRGRGVGPAHEARVARLCRVGQLRAGAARLDRLRFGAAAPVLERHRRRRARGLGGRACSARPRLRAVLARGGGAPPPPPRPPAPPPPPPPPAARPARRARAPPPPPPPAHAPPPPPSLP